MVSENTFTGEYSYSIDDKGRVNIPAKFRSALSPDNENIFVITRGFDPCVVAYPLVEWQKVEDGLRNLSSATKVYRAFIRSTVRYATSVNYDKQGRIQITPILREWAGLEKDVLIIGMVNKIEIWNPVKLEEFEKTSGEIEPEKFEDLADKIIL
ncbi:MAG: division/cell wall cluster transcriptional repressor MraZ [Candidatus Marinimicrobia bacterium]|nr:division/cell wall cluster transcriptional repressor MraZ [Candidatus Neomarinimicrobiota bacterium]